MIHLYFVDYYNINDSGLTTYVHQLSQSIFSFPNIRLHHVWLNATQYKSYIKKVDEKDITHYYIPNDVSVLSNNITGHYDNLIVEFLARDTAGKDNVIFHFNWINHCPFVELLKSKINCKTVLTKHCIPWREFITGNYFLFRALNNKFYSEEKSPILHRSLIREQLAYLSVDHIICVANFAKDALQKMFQIPEEKTTVIYNGFKRNMISPHLSKIRLREKYGFAEDEKIILFAGSIIERKGIFDLVAVFKKIADTNKPIRLIIAGGGELSKLFAEIKRYWTKITVTGHLDKETLYDFYRIADIGVIPSYVELCSYTAIEMMQNGLPIVVSNVDGLTEIVPDECGLKAELVLSETEAHVDADDLQKRIMFFLENGAIAKQYGMRAQTYALKTFNAEKMVAETVMVYYKLIKDSNNEKTLTSISKDPPLVSILLPCYNVERYVDNCINSIIAQTYTNFELIIIDDGSIDKTNSVIKRYSDPRIILIRNDQNEGIVAVLNKGIKIAKGQYVARIDADDIMRIDRLEKQVSFLEREKDISIVGSWTKIIDTHGRLIDLMQYPLDDATIKNTMLFCNPFCHPAVMIRSEVIKKIKYSSRYPNCEDFHLWFLISRKYKMANIADYLTCHRVHQNSISIKNNKSLRENTMEIITTKLQKIGVSYSVNDIAIHAAIYFRFGARYFDDPERITIARKWVNNILMMQNENNEYPKINLKAVEQDILSVCCGINEKNSKIR
jgi:glycosyltransferase involved in cell wall biosynthesis